MTPKDKARQERYVQRKLASGLCVTCTKKRHPQSARYCKLHHLKNRRRVRKIKGCAAIKSSRIIATRRHPRDEEETE